MAKTTDIRAKTDDQLNKRLSELYKEQMNLRFQKASGQLENTATIRNVRREIAQTKTILNQRQAEQNAA